MEMPPTNDLGHFLNAKLATRLAVVEHRLAQHTNSLDPPDLRFYAR
jgi:hypothetical protein